MKSPWWVPWHRALRGDEHALADHVLDLEGDVGERRPEHREELLDALAGRRNPGELLVLDEVLREAARRSRAGCPR